jgi:hypothetical protein
MILVYIDESGDTGLNFSDEQQPVFVLGALLVPQSVWKSLESDFEAIVRRSFGDAIPDNFELHTMHLVNRKGPFQSFSLDQVRAFRDGLLELLETRGLKLVYRKIDKRPFQKYCEDRFGKGIRIAPYIMALPFVCTRVDELLRKAGDLGILIFDHHRDLADIEKTLRTLRIDGTGSVHTDRLIEKGFFVDSAQSFPVQLADLVLYYVRKQEEMRLGKKVSAIHQEVFPRLSRLVESLDTHDQSLQIVDWVGREHAKRVAIAPEGGAVS